jgi:hypothetical protein
MWPIYGAEGPFGEFGGQQPDCHKPPGSDGSAEPPAGLKLEAVRLMATTDTETGNSCNSGRQVVWVSPCSQNCRELSLLHIPGGSMQ